LKILDIRHLNCHIFGQIQLYPAIISRDGLNRPEPARLVAQKRKIIFRGQVHTTVEEDFRRTRKFECLEREEIKYLVAFSEPLHRLQDLRVNSASGTIYQVDFDGIVLVRGVTAVHKHVVLILI
jgi:hypothetical protein